MERLVLRPSRKKWTLLLVVCALFVAGGVWMVVDGDAAGYFVAGFFGLVGLMAPMMLWKARLVLSPEGFTMDNGVKAKTYRWSDVDAFFPVQISTTTQVGWNFASHYDSLHTIRSINAGISDAEASLGDNFGMKVDELADLMNEWRARYATAPPEPAPETEAAPIEDVFASAPGDRRSNQYDQPPS